MNSMDETLWENLGLPKKLKDLTDALLDNGWSFVVNHGLDTGNHPYISVEAKRADQGAKVTWHTRPTDGKSYRLFTSMISERGWHDVTLTRVMAEVVR